MFLHLACMNSPDYFERRDRPCPPEYVNEKYGETLRKAHINMCLEFRQHKKLLAAGPMRDGSRADVFYDFPSAAALDATIREDPYVLGGVWASREASAFLRFTAPAGDIDICWDGSRIVTAVEGIVPATDAAQAALDGLRDAGRLAVGGVREGDRLLAWMRTADREQALAWLTEAGVGPASPTTRDMVWVM